jgi:chromosome segregation ATPase
MIVLTRVVIFILQTSSPTVTPSPVPGVPVPPNPTSWIVMFGAYATLAGACCGAAYGIYRFIKKIRDDAKKARAAEEAEVQARIEAKVTEAKAEAGKKLELAQQLTDHWEQLATIYEKERDHERELRENELRDHADEKEKLRRARQDAINALDDAKLKIEQIVDLNLGLQGKINENTDLIGKLTTQVEQLQERVNGLSRQ